MQKVLVFAAGVIIALGSLFAAFKADLLPITVYDKQVQTAAWCRGYVDGSALQYARMTGITPSADQQATVQSACIREIVKGVELPEFLGGPLVVE
jgi:hypothetical protein